MTCDRSIRAALDVSGLNVRVETITPDTARQMLANNWGNRTIRPRAVAQLAADMAAGHWQLTHQGVAFGPDGRLLDGQHRLTAVVLSGAAVQMVVWRNADPASFDVVDRGRVRSLADILGQDRRIVDAAAFITRMARGMGAVEAHHVRPILETFGDAILDIVTTAGSVAKGRTAAPIKAAAALRIMQGHREYVLRQWRALVGLHYADMTPAIQALCKQLTDEGRSSRARGSGSSLQNDRAARAWIAFDPRRAKITKIQVTDIDGIFAEMRAVICDPHR